MPGYLPNPSWSLEIKSSTERDVPERDEITNRERAVVSEVKTVKKVEQSKPRAVTLDEFYSDISSNGGAFSPISSAGLIPSNLQMNKVGVSSDSFYSESDSEFESD